MISPLRGVLSSILSSLDWKICILMIMGIDIPLLSMYPNPKPPSVLLPAILFDTGLVFLPGEFHGWRSLVGYSPTGLQRVRYNWATSLPLYSDCLEGSPLVVSCCWAPPQFEGCYSSTKNQRHFLHSPWGGLSIPHTVQRSPQGSQFSAPSQDGSQPSLEALEIFHLFLTIPVEVKAWCQVHNFYFTYKACPQIHISLHSTEI